MIFQMLLKIQSKTSLLDESEFDFQQNEQRLEVVTFFEKNILCLKDGKLLSPSDLMTSFTRAAADSAAGLIVSSQQIFKVKFLSILKFANFAMKIMRFKFFLRNVSNCVK